jgi:hypothetical protein
VIDHVRGDDAYEVCLTALLGIAIIDSNLVRQWSAFAALELSQERF